MERTWLAAQAIYGKAFNPSISLKALMYYEDGTLSDIPDGVRERLTQEARKVNMASIPQLVSRPGLMPSEQRGQEL